MKVTHYKIKAPFSLTAAVLADFHSSASPKQNRPGYTDSILRFLKDTSPDLILAPGDIFNRTNEHSIREGFNINGFHLLTEGAKIAPVYYSIGNHEQGMTDSNQAELETAGVTVLDNETASFGDVVIGGLTSGYRRDKSYYRHAPPDPDTAFVKQFSERSGFKILLCHHPEYWKKYILGYGIDVTISGHAHGGQWGFFAQRGIYAPGQGLFPKYVRGLYTDPSGKERSILAVSRGMTNTVPVPRFFNPCEIVVLHFGDSPKNGGV